MITYNRIFYPHKFYKSHLIIERRITELSYIKESDI